jgi:Zn-dependent peptidase ImmA (M78 family)
LTGPTAPEKKAISLLSKLGIATAPVPVEQIARQLGAQLTYEAFEGDISGMLFRDGDRTVIGVNSRHAPTRQRFTVAHEIGHLQIHKGQPVFIDRFVRVNMRDGQSNVEEREANGFAAELLMPRSLIPQEIDRVVGKRRDLTLPELVLALSERFEVSSAAMQYRLSNLGMVDPYSLAG